MKKRIVHCETQEQWDFVTEKLDYKWDGGFWGNYKEKSTIYLKGNSFGDTNYAGEGNYYSFQEWCDLEGYSFNEGYSVGDWVVGWHSDDPTYSKGAWLITSISECGKYARPPLKGYSTDIIRLRKATQEEIDKVSKSKYIKVDDLIEGEIYFCNMSTPEWDSLFGLCSNSRFKYRLYTSNDYNGKRFNPSDWGYTSGNNYTIATPHQKKWLKTCIKQDEFIEESELGKYCDEGDLIKTKPFDYCIIIEDCEGQNYNNWKGERDLYNKHFDRTKKNQVFECIEQSTGKYPYQILIQDAEGMRWVFHEDALKASTKAKFNNQIMGVKEPSMEELLEEAKVRYPVGTEIIPLNRDLMAGKPDTVIICSHQDAHRSGSQIWRSSGDWCSKLYEDGRWAEITSKPEPIKTTKMRDEPEYEKFEGLYIPNDFKLTLNHIDDFDLEEDEGCEYMNNTSCWGISCSSCIGGDDTTNKRACKRYFSQLLGVTTPILVEVPVEKELHVEFKRMGRRKPKDF